MNVKSYLSGLSDLNKSIETLIEKRYEAYQWCFGNLNPKLSDMPHGSGQNNSPFAKPIEKVIELDRKIDNKVDEFFDLKNQLYNFILKIPDKTQRDIIELRYIQFASWEDIAQNVGKSKRQCMRIHDKALYIVGEIINNSTYCDNNVDKS